MAKFKANNMLATFGTWGLTGLTEADFSSSAEIIEQAVAGQTYKAQLVGVPTAVFNLSLLLDTTNATALSNALIPGASGTFSLKSDGTGTYGPSFTGTGLIRQRNISLPVENFVAAQIEIGIDGALTIGTA